MRPDVGGVIQVLELLCCGIQVSAVCAGYSKLGPSSSDDPYQTYLLELTVQLHVI